MNYGTRIPAKRNILPLLASDARQEQEAERGRHQRSVQAGQHIHTGPEIEVASLVPVQCVAAGPGLFTLLNQAHTQGLVTWLSTAL